MLQVRDSTWPVAWKDWRLNEYPIWSKEMFGTSYILSASLPWESRRFCHFIFFSQKLILGEHLAHHALRFPEQQIDSGPLFSFSRQTEHSVGQVIGFFMLFSDCILKAFLFPGSCPQTPQQLFWFPALNKLQLKSDIDFYILGQKEVTWCSVVI